MEGGQETTYQAVYFQWGIQATFANFLYILRCQRLRNCQTCDFPVVSVD